MLKNPLAVILAGPNGSGKTTASATLLPEGLTFVNADLIAQEESGESSTGANINAGRKLLHKVDGLIAASQDFAIETTLATRSLRERLESWHRSGYQVQLLFFYLPSAELAVQRVKGRVAEGGHDVPEETIRRRYTAGLRLFYRFYRDLVDAWRIYDTSSDGPPRLIARKAIGGELRIADEETWRTLQEEYAQ